MLNENQRHFTIKEIDRYNAEADNAEGRVFWNIVGLTAGLVLVGISSLVAKEFLPAHAEELSTGLKVLGGVASVNFLIRANDNHSERNVKRGIADSLQTQLKIDELEEAPVGRHIKK